MPAGSGPSAGLRPGEVRSAVTEALAAWCALPLPGESVDGVTGTAGTACDDAEMQAAFYRAAP